MTLDVKSNRDFEENDLAFILYQDSQGQRQVIGNVIKIVKDGIWLSHIYDGRGYFINFNNIVKVFDLVER